MLAVGIASLFLAPWAKAQVWDAQAAPSLNWSAATNRSTDAAPVSGGAVAFAEPVTPLPSSGRDGSLNSLIRPSRRYELAPGSFPLR